MISHRNKCVFIHIPKNAGMSIEHLFIKSLGLTWKTRAPLLLGKNSHPELGPPRLCHLRAEEYTRYHYLTQEMFDDYFKFCIVRNPWSRMVSLYKFLRFDRKCDFKTFLFKKFEKKISHKKHWFVRPQSDFIYTDNDVLLTNHIIYFEDLQNGFNQVCQKIGMPQTQIPHVNISKKDSSFKHAKSKEILFVLLEKIGALKIPSYDSWQEYYDEESISYVSSLYQRDIDLLGYTFD